MAQHGLAFHLSVHSFTDRFQGQVRGNDFGLLYESWWPLERPLADRLDKRLKEHGYSVRRNFPYSGRDDGFCMRMRRERKERTYIGMEIELNQRLCRSPEGAKAMARALADALAPEFGA